MIDFDAAIAQLHKIINNEYYIQNALLNKYEESTQTLIKLVANINTQGISSKEIFDEFHRLYATEDFRRIWGSISMNFEHWLKTRPRSAATDLDPFRRFILTVVESVSVSSQVADTASETPNQLVSTRVDFTARNGVTFSNPVDFWIVCLIAFRLTLEQSELFKQEISKVIKLATENPIPLKKLKAPETIKAK